MTKFTNIQKLDAVARYQTKTESVIEIAKSIGANHEVVRIRIKQFEHHWFVAFEKFYTFYTLQFNMDVLNYMNENSVLSNEVIVIFNISSPVLIRKWRIQLSTV